MLKHRVVVLKIVANQLSVTEAAARYGISRRHLHRLLARYRAEGLDGLEPRSRRPLSNAKATPDQVRDRIVQLRAELSVQGADCGPVTIAWHLEQEHISPPSTSTIRRILTTAGMITPQPGKRARNSYIRFEAAQPNECWQSDFTHWALADGRDVEILNWLDDHSRYLLGCTAYPRVTGDTVVSEFLRLIEVYGTPASTLTDNGVVYTARFVGGANAFEYLLPLLGVKQKNGHPNHPQTQGKIERFHQTLKRWLAQQPPARSIGELQTQLNHKATPGDTYRATPPATPAPANPEGRYRIRYDRVDKSGRITLRHAGRLHHLLVGAAHRGKRVLALVDTTQVTVVHLDTGEILATNTINPTTNYWRNTQKEPGRWPGP